MSRDVCKKTETEIGHWHVYVRDHIGISDLLFVLLTFNTNTLAVKRLQRFEYLLRSDTLSFQQFFARKLLPKFLHVVRLEIVCNAAFRMLVDEIVQVLQTNFIELENKRASLNTIYSFVVFV